MGQIVGTSAKVKRCNLNAIQTGGSQENTILAAGEYMLVSSDNSMIATGNGNFDSYIVGDGTKACGKLTINTIDEITQKDFYTNVSEQIDISDYPIATAQVKTNGTWLTGSATNTCVFIPAVAGDTYRITANDTDFCRYLFLTVGNKYTNNAAADFATGYSGNGVMVEAGETVEVTAPADAKFIYFMVAAGTGVDRTPQSLIHLSQHDKYFLNELKQESKNFDIAYRTQTSYGKSQATDVWQCDRTGVYTIHLHTNDGYTTTASATQNIVSLLVYNTSAADDTNPVYNFAHKVASGCDNSSLWFAFSQDISFTLRIEQGQWVYIMDRISGTGTMEITYESSISISELATSVSTMEESLKVRSSLLYNVTYQNQSTFGKSTGTKLWQVPSTGDYSIIVRTNTPYTINATGALNAFALVVYATDDADDTTGLITKAYTSTTFLPYLEFNFTLQEGCWVYILDRITGSAEVTITGYLGETIPSTYEQLAEDVKVLKTEVGSSILTFPITYKTQTNYGKSTATKVWQVPVDGIYKISLHTDAGYTTTATGTQNVMSLRTYATDSPTDTDPIINYHYGLTATSDNDGAFSRELFWEVSLQKNQWVYILDRISGTGTLTIQNTATLVDRVDYLEKYGSGSGDADPATSNDDVATNKLDGEIYCMSATRSANTLQNLLIGWFSDIHGDVNNLQRVVDFCEHYDISTIIHTGDSVADKYGDGTPFDAENGAKVLNILGNHDTTTTSNAYENNASVTSLYNTFIAPFASSVELPSGAAANGLCYWYKDFSANGIRLIGIDCMHWTTEQSTWLVNTLSDATANSLSVIILSHYPADEISGFDTGFNSRQWSPAYHGRTLYQLGTGVIGLVDSFITNGGEFICYLTGHQHRDHVGTCTHAQNTQVQITIDSSSVERCAVGLYQTQYGKYSIDFNIVGFDLYEKCIKVTRVGRNLDRWMRYYTLMCIDYINGTLYNRYNLP